MKSNPELLTHESRRVREWDAPVSHHLPFSFNNGQTYKHWITEWFATIPSSSLSQAIYNTNGIRIYTSANTKIARVLQRAGWRVFENQPESARENDRVILFMDAGEFISKQLSREYAESNVAVITEAGRGTEEYRRAMAAEIRRVREALERSKRLRAARRSL
ncbi:MAG: hypothetical protein HRT44_13700 [Bdellovibrionales bacterium]|nr:hypothetical protein [Bdellovibrionales bacterium]